MEDNVIRIAIYCALFLKFASKFNTNTHTAMTDIFFKVYGEEHFYTFAVFIGLTYFSVLICMAIDLVCGVQKAKQNHVARTSTGFKKTSEKAAKYFTPMLCLTFIDLIIMVVIPFPVLTMAMGCWNGFCEYKSVMEKAYEKKQIMEAANTFDVVIKNKEDLQTALLQAVIEGMKHIGEEKGGAESNG